jgi:acetolactate synthase I/II/III large subunit
MILMLFLMQAMDFGLSTAVDVKISAPHKTIIDINRHASFSMTTIELQIASQFGVRVKVLVLNHRFQGMVLQ